MRETPAKDIGGDDRGASSSSVQSTYLLRGFGYEVPFSMKPERLSIFINPLLFDIGCFKFRHKTQIFFSKRICVISMKSPEFVFCPQ